MRWWLKLGCISFGGPAGQIALMHAELVERRRWLSEARFLHALNYCTVLPGPEAQQLATYLGWLLHGVRGGVAAGLLFLLPSLLLMAVLAWAYLAVGATASGALLYGVRPAVVAIVIVATWRLARRSLRRPVPVVLAFGSAAALAFGISFPLVVALAAGIGALLGTKHVASPSTAAPNAAASHRPAVLDDYTPTPPHARVQAAMLLRVAVAGTLLLAAAIALLRLTPLAATVLPAMAAFFGKAALVTFGGAYAVLPYVFDQAVNTYGWITAPQMLDGLALGESTPGPLIMVVAFIGSVGAAGDAAALAAGWSPVLLGGFGALVAAFFTFLPSFLFVLLGAPFVERSRSSSRLAAPLAAVGAAVVGGMALLAVTLAVQVVRPPSGFDGVALVLAAVGAAALLRERVGVVPLLALSAALGLAWQALRAFG